jgi:hypothetical protein
MKKIYKGIIILFLLFEIVFSFKRYLYFPIDGDLPSVVLPHKNYQAVLHDPFGVNVLLHDSVYAATNRFFTHWSMSVYFKNAPRLLQHFVSPVHSIYYSCALIKTLIQFLLIYLFAVYVTGKKRFWNPDILLAAALITPLFQTFGYNYAMGIIDHSISYVFFYALALLLVVLFFLPFFLAWFYNYKITKPVTVFLLFLAIVLSFNGPLNAPLILIICPAIVLVYFIHNFNQAVTLKLVDRIMISIKKIPVQFTLIFGFAIVCCLYSFYIGRNNSENLWESIPLGERYARLPFGLYLQFTAKLGPGLLLFMLLLNCIIIKKWQRGQEGVNLLSMLKWFGILSIVYILLLPFGGYRSYRPHIIRMDTIMPVMLGLILFYGMTTYYIIKRIEIKQKKIYYALVLIFTFIFINADTSLRKHNTCERNALEIISQSPDKIVFLDSDCSIMSWGIITDYRNSETVSELLYQWNVTKEKKFFYQEFKKHDE